MSKIYLFPLLALFLFPVTAFSQHLQAVVKEFSGKVEVKQLDQEWQPVRLNMIVSEGATVSTGFASRLLLAFGQTQIAVRPLTRMLVRELMKRDSTNVTSLDLPVGKVNVSVKAASGEKNDFTIRGPASTAAVRGTEFNFDANIDDQVDGLDGHVLLSSNITGQTIHIGPGMFGAIGDNGRLVLSAQIILQHSSSGWVPSDLLWWASQHETGLPLFTNTNNLLPPNVLSLSVGAVPTLTVTVN